MKLYAVRNKDTGKLVTGLTKPSHKFWEFRAYCEDAIKHGKELGLNNLEIVTFELVEVKERINIRSKNKNDR